MDELVRLMEAYLDAEDREDEAEERLEAARQTCERARAAAFDASVAAARAVEALVGQGEVVVTVRGFRRLRLWVEEGLGMQDVTNKPAGA